MSISTQNWQKAPFRVAIKNYKYIFHESFISKAIYKAIVKQGLRCYFLGAFNSLKERDLE